MKNIFSIILILIVVILLVVIGFIVFEKSGEGELCDTSKDCKKDYLCENSICKKKLPQYSWPNYFITIELQKIKAAVAPGPDNIPVNAVEFKTTDGINLNMQTKAGISGETYFEIINQATGQTIFTHPKFEASGLLGRGFPAPNNLGNYQLKIYFKNELIDIIDFKVDR